MPNPTRLRTRLAWHRFRTRERWRALQARWYGHGPIHQQVLLAVLVQAPPGDPAAALAVIDAFAREQRFLMNAADRKGRVLDELLTEHRPQRVLELGAYLGYTALRMGQRLAGWGGHLDTIELDPARAAVARAVVQHAGLDQVVTVHIGSAQQVLPRLGARYQLVFIDHDKSAYRSDLAALEHTGAIGPGGVVVADNVGLFAENIADYLTHVRQGGRYTSRFLDTHLEYLPQIPDGMEVSVHR